MDPSSFFCFLFAFAIGCMAAAAELFSRYKDGPEIFALKESYIYLAINGFTSLLAYWFIIEYKIDFGPWSRSAIGQAIFAGIASMVVLRSSVASIKHGDKTFEAGLAPILQVFLNVADRAFDRKRSEINLKEIEDIMRNVDFSKAVKDLPSTCLTLMQNIPKEETELVGRKVKELQNAEFDSDKAKSINLGIIISRVTGNDLLRATVTSLENIITQKHEGGEPKERKSSFAVQKEKIRELKRKFT